MKAGRPKLRPNMKFDALYRLYRAELKKPGNRVGRWKHILHAHGWLHHNWIADLQARKNGEISKL